MKYLITGGCGFVGCNLADRILSKGNEVLVFDNLLRNGANLNLNWLKENHENLEVVIGDVRNYEKLSQFVDDVDVIFHTAGQVAVTTSVLNPRQDFEINALGTFNVLEAARNAKADPSVIFTSTNKVYGGLDDVLVEEHEKRWEYKDLKTGISETRPLDFYSPYGCSKGAADQYVRDYSRIYGLKSAIFRMSCIYGTRQFGNEDQGWVAHFIISAILNKPLTIYGDGKQIRDVLYIEDLTNAFELATKNINSVKGKIYNIGGGPENTVSLLELLIFLEEMLGKRIDFSFDEWRPGDQKVYYSDVSKARRDFGWEPHIDKEVGIKMLFDWVYDNKEYIQKARKVK